MDPVSILALVLGIPSCLVAYLTLFSVKKKQEKPPPDLSQYRVLY